MEYDNKSKSIESNATTLLFQNVTERLNEQSRTIANLRALVEALEARMDEATHMTSVEYGQQVIEQIIAAMPSIQATATKRTKNSFQRPR